MSQILIFTIAFLFDLLAWNKNGSVSALELECGTNTSSYCPGDLINITCTVNSVVMRWWIFEDGSDQESSHSPYSLVFYHNDHLGDVPKTIETNSTKFTAKLVREDSQRNASALWFKFTQEMNGTTIRCERVDDFVDKTCRFFSYDLPGTVINATLNRDQCDTNALLSWTSPVSHTPILNYTLIDVIPVIGNIFEESTLTPNISLTLQLGTVHNISIQAHNCVGGGAKGYINETTTNETLHISTPPDYSLQKEGNAFKIFLFWQKPPHNCALEYSVKSKTDRGISFTNWTQGHNISFQGLKKEKTYSYSVTGINRNPLTIGNYSDPLTVSVQVPEAVYGLMIINNETSDFSITLQLKWMVPYNKTKPPIEYFVVSILDQENYTNSTNLSVSLDRSITKKLPSVQINVSAVNIVGQGRAASIEFPDQPPQVPSVNYVAVIASTVAVLLLIVTVIVGSLFLIIICIRKCKNSDERTLTTPI